MNTGNSTISFRKNCLILQSDLSKKQRDDMQKSTVTLFCQGRRTITHFFVLFSLCSASGTQAFSFNSPISTVQWCSSREEKFLSSLLQSSKETYCLLSENVSSGSLVVPPWPHLSQAFFHVPSLNCPISAWLLTCLISNLSA